MIDQILQQRTMEARDWATVIFVIALILVAVAKTAFESRFYDFLRLIVSDKYVKIYRDSSNLLSGFTIALFVVQLVSFSFFIQLALSYFGLASKTDWILFIQIFTFFSVFVLAKFLIEKIIATAFNIEEFAEQYNLQKVTYRTYIGLLLLPIDLVLFYTNNSSKWIIIGTIIIILAINLFTYLVSLKNYQNIIFGKLFYFILYLCALEIAPYYFIYYLFRKS